MIRPPAVNLARRPFRNNNLYYAVFGLCFALLLLASGYNVYDFVGTSAELERLRQEMQTSSESYRELRNDVERMKKDVAGLDLSTLDSKSSFANGLILSRFFSWSQLFDRIEELIPPDVKIRSIRPSISNTGIEIQMDGLARSPEALYEFEERLAQSAYFASVYPVSENTRESKTELNFDLAMSYIPAGKPEAVRQAADAKAGTPAASEREHAGEAPVVYAPAEGYTQADGQAEAAGTEGLPAGPSAAASRPESTKPASQRPPAAVLGDAGTVPPSPGQVPLGPGPDAGRAAASRPGEPTANIVPPAQPPGEIARATGKAAPLMTNKEMYEALGRELFLKRRGRMIPKTTTQHPDLTNEQFIEKLGESLFMKVRGGLKRDDHRPVYQPASEPESPEGS